MINERVQGCIADTLTFVLYISENNGYKHKIVDNY